MKISDIHSAKSLKFKLTSNSKLISSYSPDDLIQISRTSKDTEFYVEPFGKSQEICFADKSTAEYIDDLLRSEELVDFRCLFVIEGVNSNSLEIQAYTFRSITDYKTPIVIKVSQKALEKNSIDQLKKMFIWEGLGQPAIFSLSYKNSAKRKADIRLLSDKSFLYVQNTALGLIATEVNYMRDKSGLPIDVYIAPKIKFVTETDNSEINNEFSYDIERISKAATYFARWEAYNALAEKQLISEANKFGEISYDRVESNAAMNGTHFEFSINEEISSDFHDAELAVLAQPESNEKASENLNAKKIPIGRIRKVSRNTLVTYKDYNGNVTSIPSKGKIVLSTTGSETVIKRRNVAKERMLGGHSPIKSIVSLIEEGVSEYRQESNWRDFKAITNELRKNFKKADDLNQMQRKALGLAINTPDIALIQGPPGTGKTTVIKAISERFCEIYESNERDKQKQDPQYVIRRPKILISSFQNEAVDNAISKPLPGDLPAYRIGRKVANQFQKSLEEWVGDVRSSLESEKCNTVALAFSKQKRELLDEFFAFKNSGEPIDFAVRIIKKYLSFVEIPYPQELKIKASSIVTAHQKLGRITDDVPDPIVSKLKSQRLTKEAFADDGADNARRLVAHLRNRNDLNIPQADINAISAVYSEENLSDFIFNNYVEVVKRLKSSFFSEEEKFYLHDKANIEKCILQLADAYSNNYISMTDDLEEKKALIVGDFLDRFEYEYDDLVAKYSQTTAATCQTSMQLSRDETETYDMVIIDEAARATPLDLFIPMSMGRRIILVGDHKQLPHMLEPDVLKIILDDPQYKDLPGIEISLFERLFQMFSQGTRPKSIFLDTQYRMHPDICQFVSDAFYKTDGKGELKSGISATDRIVPKELFDGKALVYTNISIVHGKELTGASKARYAEVKAITHDIKHIMSAEPQSSIGVITFYKAQEVLLLESIQSAFNEIQLSKIEIGTVDAFQGKEFDYVLLSCVRSNEIKNNEQQSVGFLVKPNRVCVAFSRARKQLCVYADAETLNQVPYFKMFYEKCKNDREGFYREY